MTPPEQQDQASSSGVRCVTRRSSSFNATATGNASARRHSAFAARPGGELVGARLADFQDMYGPVIQVPNLDRSVPRSLSCGVGRQSSANCGINDAHGVGNAPERSRAPSRVSFRLTGAVRAECSAALNDCASVGGAPSIPHPTEVPGSFARLTPFEHGKLPEAWVGGQQGSNVSKSVCATARLSKESTGHAASGMALKHAQRRSGSVPFRSQGSPGQLSLAAGKLPSAAPQHAKQLRTHKVNVLARTAMQARTKLRQELAATSAALSNCKTSSVKLASSAEFEPFQSLMKPPQRGLEEAKPSHVPAAVRKRMEVGLAAAHLDVCGLQLGNLHWLSGQQYLQSLAASFNQLTSLPAFDLSSLKTLNLAGNRLASLPEALGSMLPNLQARMQHAVCQCSTFFLLLWPSTSHCIQPISACIACASVCLKALARRTFSTRGKASMHVHANRQTDMKGHAGAQSV